MDGKVGPSVSLPDIVRSISGGSWWACELRAPALVNAMCASGVDLRSECGTIESRHGICGSMFWPGAV
jgi:hypothetical protein